MKQPNVTYFPRIDDPEFFRDQLVRAAWYLAPINPRTIDIYSSHSPENLGPLDAFTPEVCDVLDEHSVAFCIKDSAPTEKNLASADIVICWAGLQPLLDEFGPDIVNRLRKLGVLVFDVDHQERTEGSRYIDISFRYPANDDAVIKRSSLGFQALKSEHANTRESYLLCSGPEVSRYPSFSFDRGLGIVCNSVINDQALMAKVKPKIQIFGDPIFHFGCSRYAHQFRKTLISQFRQYDFTCIVPIKYYNLICHWLPELGNRLLAVPFHVDQPINLDLAQDFRLHTTDNILTFLMLPVACSLSDEVYVLGCDGRPINENDYFWQHNEKTQFVDEMENIQLVHPSFFTVDYDEYYFRHCDNVERYFTVGEKQGKTFCSLTPSHIPAIHQREHPLARVDGSGNNTVVVINPLGTQGELPITIADADLVVHALPYSAHTASPIAGQPQIKAFTDGLSANLSLPGECEELTAGLNWLAHVLSVWAQPTLIFQPNATPAQVRALQTSALARFDSVSIISSAQFTPADTAFLSAAGGSNTPDVFVANLRLQKAIHGHCNVKLPVWDPQRERKSPSPPAELAAPTEEVQLSKTSARQAQQTWERSSKRAYLLLQEQHLDLQFEFNRSQGRLDETQAQLAGLRQALVDQTKTLERLEKHISNQGNKLERLSKADDDIRARLAKNVEGQRSDLQDIRKQLAASTRDIREKQATDMRDMQDMRKQHTTDLRDVRQKYANDLRDLQQKHVTDLRDLRQKHANDQSAARTQHAAVKEEIATLRGDLARNRDKSRANVGNASNFQHFSRYLGTSEADRLAEQWGSRLNLEIKPRALSYLAHHICVLEDSCLGRLATDITDALIRLMCVLSLKQSRIEYLEIGSLFGINMAIAWDVCRPQFRGMHLSCIDPLEGYYAKDEPDTLTGIPVTKSVLLRNLKQANVPDSALSILQGFSEDEAILESAAKRSYNFLLIDGDHSYDGVKRDFENYSPLVDSGGYLIIDDYGSPEWPEIAKYADSAVIDDQRFELVGAQSRTLVMRRV